jgi:hypothetical protein
MSAYCDKVRPPRTIPPSSNWHQSEFGCALVSPRPISANIHWYRVPPTRRDVQSVLDKLSVTTTGPPSPRHCELAKLPANVSCWPPEVASAVASKAKLRGDLPDGWRPRNPVQPSREKYFCFSETQISCIVRPVSPRPEGRYGQSSRT